MTCPFATGRNRLVSRAANYYFHIPYIHIVHTVQIRRMEILLLSPFFYVLLCSSIYFTKYFNLKWKYWSFNFGKASLRCPSTAKANRSRDMRNLRREFLFRLRVESVFLLRIACSDFQDRDWMIGNKMPLLVLASVSVGSRVRNTHAKDSPQTCFNSSVQYRTAFLNCWCVHRLGRCRRQIILREAGRSQ